MLNILSSGFEIVTVEYFGKISILNMPQLSGSILKGACLQ